MLPEKQNTERKEHKEITCHLPNDTDVNIPKLYIKRCLIKFEYAIQITTWATYYIHQHAGQSTEEMMM